MIDPQFKPYDSLPVPVSVLELDANNRPCYVALNRAGCAAFHFKLKDVLDKTAVDIFGERIGKKIYELHVQAFASGEIVVDEQTLPIGGEQRTLRTTLTPEFDDFGAIVRIVGMPTDVTTEDELRAVEVRAAKMNQEMEQFISLAAHDLRSPMRKVHQIASLLRLDLPQLSENDSKLLDMLENVATKSLQMITDLVSHSQAADIASIEAIPEPYSLLEVVTDILVSIDPEQRHHCQVDEACILGERIASQIVIRNLLDNAIKHNAEPLTLSVITRQTDSTHIELSVSDDGKGFSSSSKTQIQDERLSAEGGFGLAGIRRLIASRGGSITVDEPVAGKGATIRVRLPGTIWDSLASVNAG